VDQSKIATFGFKLGHQGSKQTSSLPAKDEAANHGGPSPEGVPSEARPDRAESDHQSSQPGVPLPIAVHRPTTLTVRA